VGLANSLGLDVVAEGVETAEILEPLRVMGCHQAQGFYMCRPQPAEQLDEWVRGRHFVPAVPAP
jgi:EAL domain-containing protein (putative c-di-GMP-specific phosphodiesterase class I)